MIDAIACGIISSVYTYVVYDAGKLLGYINESIVNAGDVVCVVRDKSGQKLTEPYKVKVVLVDESAWD